MADQDLQRGLATGVGAAKTGQAIYNLTQGAGAGAAAGGAGALLSALAAATGDEGLAEAAQAVGLVSTIGGAAGLGTTAAGASAIASGAAVPLAPFAPILAGVVNLGMHLGTAKARAFARTHAARQYDAAMGARANEILGKLAGADVSKLDPDLVARGFARGASTALGARGDIDRHMAQVGLRGGEANEAAYGGVEANRGYLGNLLTNEAKVINTMRDAADKAVTSGRYKPPAMEDYTGPVVGQYAGGTNPYDIIAHQAALQVNPRLTELGLDPKKQGVKERVQFKPVDLSGATTYGEDISPEVRAHWIETLRGTGNLGWARVQPDGSVVMPTAPPNQQQGQLPFQDYSGGGP